EVQRRGVGTLAGVSLERVDDASRHGQQAGEADVIARRGTLLRHALAFSSMIRAFLRVALVSCVCAAPILEAQRPAPRPSPPVTNVDPLYQSGRNVTISLLTMGTGEEVWELFGHDAILIHDNVTGRDTVFNWGVFNFRQPRFIQRFLKGTM